MLYTEKVTQQQQYFFADQSTNTNFEEKEKKCLDECKMDNQELQDVFVELSKKIKIFTDALSRMDQSIIDFIANEAKISVRKLNKNILTPSAGITANTTQPTSPLANKKPPTISHDQINADIAEYFWKNLVPANQKSKYVHKDEMGFLSSNDERSLCL